jgi:hypothetical protein
MKPDLNAAALATLVAQCQSRAVNAEMSNAVKRQKMSKGQVLGILLLLVCVLCVY